MNKMNLLSAAMGLLLAGCSMPKIPDPHHHVIDIHAAPWTASMATDARLVWVDPPPPDRIQNVVTNQNKTARAYVVEKAWTGVSVRDHIQIEDLNLRKYLKSREFLLNTGHTPILSGLGLGILYLTDGHSLITECIMLLIYKGRK